MINLLPTEDKKEARAARMNTVLRRYIIILIGAAVFLCAIFLFAWYGLYYSYQGAQRRISDSQRETAAYKDTKQQAEDFSNNLATAKAILDKNIAYSTLMLHIAKQLPYSVRLSDLSLDVATLSEPLTFSLTIQKKEDAINLRHKLAAEDTLFSDVHIVQINETEKEGIHATLSVTLAKGAFDAKTQ